MNGAVDYDSLFVFDSKYLRLTNGAKQENAPFVK